MAHSYEEKQQPSNRQYPNQPSFPSQYSASAPSDTEFPIPPPQYSVLDPSLQQPHTPFIQHQQHQQSAAHQQQPQPLVQQHVVVLQIPR